MLERTTEPELMEDVDQVQAYADADWSASHDRLIDQISTHFPGFGFSGTVLNLGCGSGDDSFRFLHKFPKSRMVSIDGSTAMIARAKGDLEAKHPELVERVEFRAAYIPSNEIPKLDYVAIVSNSLLHHFHNPNSFWTVVREHSRSGTSIFVADLRRPQSIANVDDLIATYATDAPEILKTDFRNSLRAAFTASEIVAQLESADLSELEVQEVGDRHLVMFGTRR